MTNIDEMEAGHELDALIAEKVMGWTWYDGRGTGGPSYWQDKDGECRWSVCWEPSLIPNTAIYVVDYLLEYAYTFELQWLGANYGWWCRMGCQPDSGATARTREVAICRAALKAVEQENLTMNVCYVGGCGRLGLPFACWAAEKGHRVRIADINEEAVNKVNAGRWNTIEPGVSDLVAKHAGGNLTATTDTAAAVAQSEIVFIIVPTPSDENGRFMLDYVLAACDDIRPALTNQIVVVSSTVMPGSCDGPIRERLGRDVVYNPEFVRQGNILADYSKPDFVIIGGDDEKCHIVGHFLRTIVENDAGFHYMSTSSAEIAKIGLNSALVFKLAVANQVAWLCQNVPGADAAEALAAIGADSRIGHKYLRPGTPPGGPCLPRDCRAFAAAGYEFNAPMPPMVTVNGYPVLQTQMLADLVMNYEPECVGILGLTYRPGVDIVEESQGIALLEALDCYVWYNDPIIFPEVRISDGVERSDLLILMTCHAEYKQLETMDLTGKIVVDMWGFLDEDRLNCDKYVRFGRNG